MVVVDQKDSQIAFGDWSFDKTSGELSGPDETVRLEPQVAKLLVYLYQNQNRVISKDELIESLWRGRVVSDHAFNRCLSLLRRTISQDDKDAFIKTVPRRGYISLFPPPAMPENKDHSQSHLLVEPPPNNPNKKYSIFLFAGTFIVLLCAIWLFLSINNSSGKVILKQPPLIAVMPFDTEFKDQTSELMAQDIFDDLLSQLSQLPSIRVISKSASVEYHSSGKSISQIAKESNIEYLVKGILKSRKESLRVYVELINTNTGEQLWSKTFPFYTKDADTLKVYAAIANDISRQLPSYRSSVSGQKLSYMPTQNMTAYRLYRDAINTIESGEISRSSPQHLARLEEVVKIDPNFTQARSELVALYSYLDFKKQEKLYVERAEYELQQLTESAPDSVERLYAQAAYVYYAVEDYPQAYSIINQAVDTHPGNRSALSMKANLERRLNKNSSRINTLRLIRNLDPLNPKRTEAILHGLAVEKDYDQIAIELDKYARSGAVGSGEIDYFRHLLAFRKHRNIDRFQNDTLESCRFSSTTYCGWLASVANRDYEQAMTFLEGVDMNVSVMQFRTSHRQKLYTLWLMQQKELSNSKVQDWLLEFSKSRQTNAYGKTEPFRSEEVFLHVVNGDLESASNLIDKFFLKYPIDWAERIVLRSEICRIFGVMGNVEQTVRCIREGLEQGSSMHPFLEHYLPFYDSVRQSKAFVDLIKDIDEDYKVN